MQNNDRKTPCFNGSYLINEITNTNAKFYRMRAQSNRFDKIKKRNESIEKKKQLQIAQTQNKID